MRSLRHTIVFLLCGLALAAGLLLCSCTPSVHPGDSALEAAQVVRVVDGDTLVVSRADGQKERVRLVGIDCDLPCPPAVLSAMAGATVIAAPCAESRIMGGCDVRMNSIAELSDRLSCGYVFANAGLGESTQDGVFGGERVIAECGDILEADAEDSGIIFTETDVERIAHIRRGKGCFSGDDTGWVSVFFGG